MLAAVEFTLRGDEGFDQGHGPDVGAVEGCGVGAEVVGGVDYVFGVHVRPARLGDRVAYEFVDEPFFRGRGGWQVGCVDYLAG